MEKNREFLQGLGINSFYYHSHAPFLFMADKKEILMAVRNRLVLTWSTASSLRVSGQEPD